MNQKMFITKQSETTTQSSCYTALTAPTTIGNIKHIDTRFKHIRRSVPFKAFAPWIEQTPTHAFVIRSRDAPASGFIPGTLTGYTVLTTTIATPVVQNFNVGD